MIGRPIQLAAGHLSAWLVQPDVGDASLAVVVLNAGLLPAYGPYGLHTQIAELLATRGITTLLLDQSGKGESLPRPGFDRLQALEADFDTVQAWLADLGIRNLALVGLCSGADDAVQLADKPGVRALVLLDPLCKRDLAFFAQRYAPRLLRPRPARAVRKIIDNLRQVSRGAGGTATAAEAYDSRGAAPLADQRTRLRRFLASQGALFTAFTGSVSEYYGYAGQYRRFLGARRAKDGIPPKFAEHHLPTAEHTYTTQQDRENLLNVLVPWLEAESKPADRC
ncbi:MAG: hypothetical protein AAF648_10785 [Pseudomonadota bacterium]